MNVILKAWDMGHGTTPVALQNNVYEFHWVALALKKIPDGEMNVAREILSTFTEASKVLQNILSVPPHFGH